MNLHGFELVRDRPIPELGTEARLYRHLKTGAELLSLESDDENKCFGITFVHPRLPTRRASAHILEHCVLCGSRKYPLKDPFVELIKGSLKHLPERPHLRGPDLLPHRECQHARFL